MAQALMQPVSGTFELRRRSHREDPRPPRPTRAAGDGAAASRERTEAATAAARPPLDGVPSRP